LGEAEDREIIHEASLNGQIVVTLDADFHALLALSHAEKPSVLGIRVEGLKADDISLLVQYVLDKCEKELDNGAVVSVSETQVRLRLLPLS